MNPRKLKLVNIELSSLCNLSCNACTRTHRTSTGLMSFDLFKDIVDEASTLSLEDVPLFHAGEPLMMREKIIEYLDYGIKKGLPLSFWTNGVLMHKDVAKELAKLDIQHIGFSIFGTNREEYKEWTGVDAYDKVIENIKTFLDLNLMVRTVYIKVIFNSFKHLLEEVKLPEFEKDKRVTVIKAHASVWDGSARLKNAKKYKKEFPCPFLMTGFVVLNDGRAVACCCDLTARYIVGDFRKEKLIDIWNGKMFELQELQLAGKKDFVPCNTCL